MKVLMSQDELDTLFLMTGKIAGNPERTLRYVFSEGRSQSHQRSLHHFKHRPDYNLMSPEIFKLSENNFNCFCYGSVEFEFNVNIETIIGQLYENV